MGCSDGWLRIIGRHGRGGIRSKLAPPPRPAHAFPRSTKVEEAMRRGEPAVAPQLLPEGRHDLRERLHRHSPAASNDALLRVHPRARPALDWSLTPRRRPTLNVPDHAHASRRGTARSAGLFIIARPTGDSSSNSPRALRPPPGRRAGPSPTPCSPVIAPPPVSPALSPGWLRLR